MHSVPITTNVVSWNPAQVIVESAVKRHKPNQTSEEQKKNITDTSINKSNNSGLYYVLTNKL